MASAGLRLRGATPTQEEVAQVVGFTEDRHGLLVRRAAVWALAEWSRGSEGTRAALLAAGAPGAMLRTADAARGLAWHRDVQLQVVGALQRLAHGSVQGWLPFLLDAVEEGIATADVALTAQGMNTLARMLGQEHPRSAREHLAEALLAEEEGGRRRRALRQQRFRAAVSDQERPAAVVSALPAAARPLDEYLLAGDTFEHDSMASSRLEGLYRSVLAAAAAREPRPAPPTEGGEGFSWLLSFWPTARSDAPPLPPASTSAAATRAASGAAASTSSGGGGVGEQRPSLVVTLLKRAAEAASAAELGGQDDVDTLRASVAGLVRSLAAAAPEAALRRGLHTLAPQLVDWLVDTRGKRLLSIIERIARSTLSFDPCWR